MGQNISINTLLRVIEDNKTKNALNVFLSIKLKDFEKSLASLSSIKNKKNERTYRRVGKELTALLVEGEHILEGIDSLTVKKNIKIYFRETLAKWFSQSKVAHRGYIKPRGYGGDYKVIEMFYDQKIISSNEIGSFFDWYVINNSLAKADITRKDKMRELLKNFILKYKKPLEIVNFGCGASKDLRDLFASFSPKFNIKIKAIDQDIEALKLSGRYARKWPSLVEAKFIQQNIIQLINASRNRKKISILKDVDLVYSIGLVDYFADNVLKLFVKFCVDNIPSGGKFIFAHKNGMKRESFLAADWVCDWRFYQRTKDEVLLLIENEIKGCDLKITWEKTKHMFFIMLTKR